MRPIDQNYSKETLSPQKIQKKADILENNLFKSISKQTDPSKMHITINRAIFPDSVISKALLQLTPKFNIKPRKYLMGLRDLLQKDIPEGKKEIFEEDLSDMDETLFDDSNIISRSFKAIASRKELEIIVTGIPVINSVNGEISKSFFNHELSPGKLLKGGAINFKEINKYPIINAEEKLFFIAHEKKGVQGVSFDGKIIPVEDPKPFIIHIGPGVERIESQDEKEKSNGYFLQSTQTGVIVLNRNEEGIINGIGINNKVEVKKLDYSTGNIGTEYTCPISMKIGEICNDFKIRVNGKVEAGVVDGGHVITNNEAIIDRSQPGSSIMALKDIQIGSAARSKIISDHGTITINKDLIDCEIFSSKVIFKKTHGLMVNNKIETEHLTFSGLQFSGKNIIHFGKKVFVEKEELLDLRENLKTEKLDLANTEKKLMETLQSELKRMAKLALAYPDLLEHIKSVIIATKTMDYEIIFKEMAMIREKNNTKIITNIKKLFERLNSIPKSIKSCEHRESTLSENLKEIHKRMALMKLSIEGSLKPGATLEIFCGLSDNHEKIKPDSRVESSSNDDRYIKISGRYSSSTGFEFIQ